LTLTGVAVEKGTQAVISANFWRSSNEHSITYEQISIAKTRAREFFNSHGDFTR
jgi:hypothetical protein